MVEEYLKKESKHEEMGEILDAQHEQDLEDCILEEDEVHADYEHLDPNYIEAPSTNSVVTEKLFKAIDTISKFKEQSKAWISS